jgi:spore maturation protein CgeB
MRFLILNTDYPQFMHWLYEQNRGLRTAPYDEQMRARNLSHFGLADSYSGNLRRLGHEAWDLHINNEIMQRAWAREHGLVVKPHSEWRVKWRRGVVPWPVRVEYDDDWFRTILRAQIEHYQPDIIFNTDMHRVPYDMVMEFKRNNRMLVGQNPQILPEETGWKTWKEYDLLTSSFPGTIDLAMARDLPAVLHRLGFDPSILDRIGAVSRDIPVSFVGSFFDMHSLRTELLNQLCQHTPLQVWGVVPDPSPLSHCLAQRYRGPAWGVEMFSVLRRSRIVVNHHGHDLPYANNMRLYETTGTGALLITDWKENIADMFEPGKEVVCYRSNEECIELVQYYLEHEEERAAIASAGQERTLRDHTYARRIEELLDLLAPYLERAGLAQTTLSMEGAR